MHSGRFLCPNGHERQQNIVRHRALENRSWFCAAFSCPAPVYPCGSMARGIFYYVGNIDCDISGITRKSTAENPIGAADFLIWREVPPTPPLHSPVVHLCQTALSCTFAGQLCRAPSPCTLITYLRFRKNVDLQHTGVIRQKTKFTYIYI